METIRLISGYAMPTLGLGTWAMRGKECKAAVKTAIELGYTHIDTAWMYDNQRDVGEAIQEIGVARSDLFITSKIWQTHLKYNDVLSQCDECLQQLQIDYVDLLLIHWPNETVPMEETLDAFNKIHDAGKAKSIGVSNFSTDQVNRAREISQAPICMNQVEYNVRHNQDALLAHCTMHQVMVTAHRPLAKGQIIHEPILSAIAEEHGKTAAQVALRWLRQKGIIAIPKSSSESHLRENLDMFDWNLTPEEMEQINNISG
ncbi:MAG: aldo/keto reductase [Candidatus Poribacteria bacterium]